MILNLDQYRHPSGPHGRIVTVVNGKGGTNKTTTVVALAALAAENGQRVLVVDADDQGTATKWFGQRRTPHLFDAIEHGAQSFDSLTVETSVRGLSLVPGSAELKDADARLVLRSGVP